MSSPVALPLAAQVTRKVGAAVLRYFKGLEESTKKQVGSCRKMLLREPRGQCCTVRSSGPGACRARQLHSTLGARSQSTMVPLAMFNAAAYALAQLLQMRCPSVMASAVRAEISLSRAQSQWVTYNILLCRLCRTGGEVRRVRPPQRSLRGAPGRPQRVSTGAHPLQTRVSPRHPPAHTQPKSSQPIAAALGRRSLPWPPWFHRCRRQHLHLHGQQQHSCRSRGLLPRATVRQPRCRTPPARLGCTTAAPAQGSLAALLPHRHALTCSWS